ncbi:MAG: MiaB/RimO family radical SAM methylthiotransferase [Peptococcaceae bacterium]|nr:MiaB/RimO family radical SAM methylthiotransferase [Peptococcaceae bacterium]
MSIYQSPTDNWQALRVSLLSLGCKVNQTETEGLAELFREAGYDIVEPPAQPRVWVINTCAVTAAAEGKSRRLIRRIVRDHPESVVAVMGCFSQMAAEEVRALGAHVVVGTRERRSLPVYVEKYLADMAIAARLSGAVADEVKAAAGDKMMVEGGTVTDAADAAGETGNPEIFEELPRLNREKRVRATVKVQDGCDHGCSYCLVPNLRGPSRSRQPARVLEEVRSLVGNGYKEIVLTGIHLGCYGRDLGQTLAGLIERVADVPGLARLRLSSLESVEIVGAGAAAAGGATAAGGGLLDVLAAHRDIVCPHFHIPLQSGSDRILAGMGRPYSRADYLEVLRAVRRCFPDAAVTTDIMAGFPGETNEDAKETLEMIAVCAFADVHAFGFSPRPGTPAAAMSGQVGPKVKAARVKALIEAGRKSRAGYLERFFGQRMEVLLEHVDGSGARGHTRNYIAVSVPAQACLDSWRSGDLVEVILQEHYV